MRLRIPTHIRVLVLFVLMALLFDGKCVWVWLHTDKHDSLNDFIGMWSYGRLIVMGQVKGLYDPVGVATYVRSLFPAMHGWYLPYFYPPTTMFFLTPLGMLTYPSAWLLWTVSGLAAFIAAGAWRSALPGLGLLLLVLPVTMVEVLFGQLGLFIGALLLGGLRLVPHRPALAGMLFGLLCIKPQMGVLLPVALIAARQWRTLFVAAATAAVLGGASGFVFGWKEWEAWLRVLPIADGQWHTDAWKLSQFAPTFTASLAAAHVPWPLIRAVQGTLLLLSGTVVWCQFRQGWSSRAVALLCACFFLATPHGFVYDMPAVCGGLVLFAIRCATTRIEQFAILLTQMVPIFAIWGRAPFVLPAIMAFLVVSLMLPAVSEWVIDRPRRLPTAEAPAGVSP